MCIIVPISPKKRIDFEDVKQCPEFCHLTDEQAKEIAETIKRFTEIVYSYSSHQLEDKQSGGKVIALQNQKRKAS